MLSFSLLGGGWAAAQASPLCSDGVERIDYAEAFARRGAVGSAVVVRASDGACWLHDGERAGERLLPASTFKILHALIALELGTVPDVDHPVVWDGRVRAIPVWNRDHSLRTGVAVSAVWLFQELARRLGHAASAEAVASVGYGNSDVGDPDRPLWRDGPGGSDAYWLRGPLAISAREQVAFLGRLEAGELPFRNDVQAAVREILVVDRGPDWTLHAKTGLALSADPVLGWYVGWLEHEGGPTLFALNVDAVTPAIADARSAIAIELLALDVALDR